jgi:hypothetical protein
MHGPGEGIKVRRRAPDIAHVRWYEVRWLKKDRDERRAAAVAAPIVIGVLLAIPILGSSLSVGGRALIGAAAGVAIILTRRLIVSWLRAKSRR